MPGVFAQPDCRFSRIILQQEESEHGHDAQVHHRRQRLLRADLRQRGRPRQIQDRAPATGRERQPAVLSHQERGGNLRAHRRGTPAAPTAGLSRCSSERRSAAESDQYKLELESPDRRRTATFAAIQKAVWRMPICGHICQSRADHLFSSIRDASWGTQAA